MDRTAGSIINDGPTHAFRQKKREPELKKKKERKVR